MLVGSAKGVNRIAHTELKAALYDIKKSAPDSLHEDQAKAILAKHGITSDDAFEYLKTIIPFDSDAKRPFYTKLVIMSSRAIHEILKPLINSRPKPCQIFYEESYSDKLFTEDHSSTLFLLIEEQLNPTKLKNFYYSLASNFPSSGIVVGYFSPGHFTLTAPFISEVGNPCVFCKLSRLQHYEDQKTGQSAWTRLLSFANKHHTAVFGESPTPLQTHLACLLANEQVLKYTTAQGVRLQDNNMLSSSINLTSGHVVEESTSHWCLCDCLGMPSC